MAHVLARPSVLTTSFALPPEAVDRLRTAAGRGFVNIQLTPLAIINQT